MKDLVEIEFLTHKIAIF